MRHSWMARASHSVPKTKRSEIIRLSMRGFYLIANFWIVFWSALNGEYTCGGIMKQSF